jgi:Bacterial self-protective colicin-like immunity
MTAADWRALLEAFLDARLSADAFARRFVEAWREARERAEAVPQSIQRLASVVEIFSPTARPGHPFEASEAQMREAAQEALRTLETDVGGARTYDRARAREEWRRLRLQVSGCAGLGCVIALVWVALCLLQIFAVSDQIQAHLGWSAAPAAFAGLVLAFIPVLGNVLAFFGAKDVWGWDPLLAVIVFFAAPAATILSGWTRWRRYGR